MQRLSVCHHVDKGSVRRWVQQGLQYQNQYQSIHYRGVLLTLPMPLILRNKGESGTMKPEMKEVAMTFADVWESVCRKMWDPLYCRLNCLKYVP